MPGRCSWRLSTSKPHTPGTGPFKEFQDLDDEEEGDLAGVLSRLGVPATGVLGGVPCALGVPGKFNGMFSGIGTGASSNLLPLRLLLLLSPPTG